MAGQDALDDDGLRRPRRGSLAHRRPDRGGGGRRRSPSTATTMARSSPWSSPPRLPPRAAVQAKRGDWPHGRWRPPTARSTGRSPACRGPRSGRPTRPRRHPRPRRCSTPRPESPVPVAAPNRAPVIDTSVHSGTLRLWDLPGETSPTTPSCPTPRIALEQGRESPRERRRPARRRSILALVLRLRPALAPAVLDLVGDRTRRLALVRGDAYRLVGREPDARQAFADALRREPASLPTSWRANPPSISRVGWPPGPTTVQISPAPLATMPRTPAPAVTRAIVRSTPMTIPTSTSPGPRSDHRRRHDPPSEGDPA